MTNAAENLPIWFALPVIIGLWSSWAIVCWHERSEGHSHWSIRCAARRTDSVRPAARDDRGLRDQVHLTGQGAVDPRRGVREDHVGYQPRGIRPGVPARVEAASRAVAR